MIKYKEVFTGFIAKDHTEYFDLPYVVDVKKLTDVLPVYKEAKIPRLGMLLVLGEVNSSMTWRIQEKISSRSVI